MADYIIDDRIDDEKLRLDIDNMTDDEFEKFQKKVQDEGKYPDKYYIH